MNDSTQLTLPNKYKNSYFKRMTNPPNKLRKERAYSNVDDMLNDFKTSIKLP